MGTGPATHHHLKDEILLNLEKPYEFLNSDQKIKGFNFRTRRRGVIAGEEAGTGCLCVSTGGGRDSNDKGVEERSEQSG